MKAAELRPREIGAARRHRLVAAIKRATIRQRDAARKIEAGKVRAIKVQAIDAPFEPASFQLPAAEIGLHRLHVGEISVAKQDAGSLDADERGTCQVGLDEANARRARVIPLATLQVSLDKARVGE